MTICSGRTQALSRASGDAQGSALPPIDPVLRARVLSCSVQRVRRGDFGKAPETVEDVFEGQLEELDSAPVPVRQARAALILLLKVRGESLEQFRKSIERGDVDLVALSSDVRWGLKYAGLLNRRVQPRP